MKHTTITSATLLAIFAMAPVALAHTTTSENTATVRIVDDVTGTIQRVAQDGESFVLESEGRTVTVKLQQTTEYTLDGQATTRERALIVGRSVTVTRDGDQATKVAVTSPPK